MSAAGRRSEGSAAADQVVRMLALVPHISRRPGVSIADLAIEFAVSREQIVADLNVLMMCGEPGYYPQDLIDVVFDDEDGTVSIGHDAGLDQPVRLSPDEAISLTVALRVLADLPGLVDGDAVRSALTKLESAAGDASVAAGASVSVTAADPGPALAIVRTAIDDHRRLRMTYYTASRDSTTERDVDPIRVLVVDGRSYLEGYCYRAEAIRRFRIDRIDAVDMLAVPTQQPLWVDESIPRRLFAPGPRSASATLRLAPTAGWVAEYYLVDTISPVADDGSRIVSLRGPDDEWLIRLVLSLGGAVRVVDRPELAAEARRRATKALAAYDVIPDDAEAGDGGG